MTTDRLSVTSTWSGLSRLPTALEAIARWGDRRNTPEQLKWTALQAYCLTCREQATESVDWCLACSARFQPARTGVGTSSQWAGIRTLAA
jgi:hypothetical protein